jgi:hypothetical protein
MMLKPLRLAICLIVTPAILASSCGSSKTTTTHTTVSAPAATGATATATTSGATGTTATKTTPASKSPPATAPPATTRGLSRVPAKIPGTTPKEERHFNEAREVQHQLAAGHLTKQAAKAKREHIEKVLENETIGHLGTEAIRHRVPSRKQFPTEVQRAFVTGCTSTKKSISSCECILAKFEEGKGERALRIAELLYSEARMRLHESLAPRIQRIVNECARA